MKRYEAALVAIAIVIKESLGLLTDDERYTRVMEIVEYDLRPEEGFEDDEVVEFEDNTFTLTVEDKEQEDEGTARMVDLQVRLAIGQEMIKAAKIKKEEAYRRYDTQKLGQWSRYVRTLEGQFYSLIDEVKLAKPSTWGKYFGWLDSEIMPFQTISQGSGWQEECDLDTTPARTDQEFQNYSEYWDPSGNSKSLYGFWREENNNPMVISKDGMAALTDESFEALIADCQF